MRILLPKKKKLDPRAEKAKMELTRWMTARTHAEQTMIVLDLIGLWMKMLTRNAGSIQMKISLMIVEIMMDQTNIPEKIVKVRVQIR